MRRALAWLRRRVEPRDVVMILLVAACLVFTTVSVRASDHKFCQVISGVTAVPVPKPADPASNPSREKQYELYEQFAALGQALGC